MPAYECVECGSISFYLNRKNENSEFNATCDGCGVPTFLELDDVVGGKNKKNKDAAPAAELSKNEEK